MKTKMVIFNLLGVIALTHAFNANPKLANAQPNSWTLYVDAGIALAGHTAYSGAVYDRTNHQYLVWGGGHWDGWKNDILALDVEKGTWKSMYTPDPPNTYVCSNVSSATPGKLLNTGMPASRHTYDQIEFMDHLGKMVAWSGPTYSGIWSCGGNTLPADTWLYDFSTNQWEYKNVMRRIQPTGQAKAGAYDARTGIYYAYDNAGTFWTFFAETDRWTKLPKSGGPNPSAYDGSILTDRKRNVFWLAPSSGSRISKYNPQNNTWTEHASLPGGIEKDGSYDELNDVIVFMNSSGSGMQIYHPDSDTWESKSVSNPYGGRCYGRFVYDPVDNVHLYMKQVNYKAQTWAYKYKGGVGPTATEARKSPAITGFISASPNPFTSTITLSFNLGNRDLSGQHFSFKIFDMSGKMVKDFTKTPSHSVKWDAAGQPSGLYLAKIRNYNRTITKRLHLVN